MRAVGAMINICRRLWCVGTTILRFLEISLGVLRGRRAWQSSDGAEGAPRVFRRGSF